MTKEKIISVSLPLALFLSACGGGANEWQGAWGLVSENGSSPSKVMEITHEPQSGRLIGQYAIRIIGNEDICRFPDHWAYDQVTCTLNDMGIVLAIDGNQLTLSEDDGDSYSLVRINGA